MRVTLLDWLVKLADEMNLGSDTYALTIHLIDLALSREAGVKRSQFQLLGCACLLIASKLEELQPPLVADLVYRSDYCFDNEELINYEQRMMGVFELRPSLPTRYSFTKRYCLAAGCSAKEESLAIYLTELSLYEVEFCALNMSKVAAAAVHLTLQILRPRGTYEDEEEAEQKRSSELQGRRDSQSRTTLERHVWTKSLEHYTGYQECELVDTVLRLREAHFHVEDTTLTQGIMYRYSREINHRVSCVGALRIEDVRWDTLRAWVAYKQHPLSLGYKARPGDSDVEGHNLVEKTAPLAEVGLNSSTNTCDLRRHAPPVLASDLQAEQQNVQQPTSELSGVTNIVSDVLGNAGERRTSRSEEAKAKEIVNAQLVPLRASEPMPDQSAASAPGRAKVTRTVGKSMEEWLQQKRPSVTSTSTRLSQAASKVTQRGGKPTNHDLGKSQGSNRTKIDALRSLSLSSAPKRQGVAKRSSNASISKAFEGTQVIFDKAQFSRPPSNLSNAAISSGSSAENQPEEAPPYTSQATGEGLSRNSRSAGQAMNTLQDIMKSGGGAFGTSSSSSNATTSTTTSAATSTTSNDGSHLLHVSRNSAFHPATTMKRLGSVSNRSKINPTAENTDDSAEVALPSPKRRRSA